MQLNDSRFQRKSCYFFIEVGGTRFISSEFGQHYVSGAIGALHAGELEAIRLAEEIGADLVILDDLRARQKAKTRNQKVIGTLGILKLAQEKDFLEKATFVEYLDALVNQHGMWLSEKLLLELKK